MARTSGVVGVFVGAVFTLACSNMSGGQPQAGSDAGTVPGPGAGPGTGAWAPACGARVNQPPGPTAEPYCPPLDELAAWIVGSPECPDQVYPTDRELACNAARYPRMALPTTMVTTELDWGNLEDRADGARLRTMGAARYIFELTDALDASGVPRDHVSPGISGLPPYFEFHGPNGTVDLVSERATLEASMRVYGAHVLRERAKGKIGVFSYGLGAHEPQPPSTNSAADIEVALRDVMVPRVAMAAKVAELVNAEVFAPFPGESDILATIPGLSGIAPAERFRLVQLYVDTVRAAARQHFTGKLMGASAWRYFPTDHPLYASIDMSQINWQGYDFVEFTLLIGTNDHCDAQYTKDFLAAQTAKIDAMAQRDHFAWGSSEIDIFTFDSVTRMTTTGGCTVPARDAYFPVLDATLQGFLDAPSRPAFLNLTNGPSAWASDQAFVDTLKGKLNAFSTAIKRP